MGHGRLAPSQVPHSGARGGPEPLGELLSFTVCYSQTTHPPHTQASPSVPSAAACPYLHFYAPPHAHFFILFCHSGAPPFRVSVAPARVPSPPRTKATACPTCHCRHNKGVRCDTCPCYPPLCIFPGVSFSPRTKTCE